MIAVVSHPHHRREFSDYCRFARKIDNPTLRTALDDLGSHPDPEVRRRADWMRFFCQHGYYGDSRPTLLDEFRAIGPLPGATAKNHPRVRQLISAVYRTTAMWAEIREHYAEQLAQNGWQFGQEKVLHYWGRDLGG